MSDGQPDHEPTTPAPSPAPGPNSLFAYRPPPASPAPTSPPAPYGYPPAAEFPARNTTVPPAPDKVRASASVPGPAVPGHRPEGEAPVATGSPAATGSAGAPYQVERPEPAVLPAPPVPAFSPTPPKPPGAQGPQGPQGAGTGGASGSARVPEANRATPPPGELPQVTATPRLYQAADPVPSLPTRTAAEPPPDPPPFSAEAPPADTRLPRRSSPRQRQAGLPVYGDLLGPAPEAAHAAQSAPASPPAPYQAPPAEAGWPGEPAGRWQAPPPPAPTEASGQGGPAGWPPAAAPAAPPYTPQPPPPFGAPQPSPPYGATQPGPPPFSDPASLQRYDAAQPPPPWRASPPREGHPEQVAEPPAAAEPAEARSGLPVGVIVGAVLVGATVLVLGALSVPFLLERLNPPPPQVTYSVGDCVTQNGEAARPAECTEPGAFEIVSQVGARDECEDPTQPAVEVAGPPVRFYCLTPVSTDSPES